MGIPYQSFSSLQGTSQDSKNSSSSELDPLSFSLTTWLGELVPKYKEKLSHLLPSQLIAVLQDGVILCEAISHLIAPSKIEYEDGILSPSQRMNNVMVYLDACQKIGLDQSNMLSFQHFQSSDKHEEIMNHLVGLKNHVEQLECDIKAVYLNPTQTKIQLDRPKIGHIINPSTSSTPTNSVSNRNPTGTVLNKGKSRHPSVIPLDHDLATKQEFKYNPELELNLQNWIEKCLSLPPSAISFAEFLKSGVILCRLMNTIQPNIIPSIYQGPLYYRQMENISNYIKACRKIGILDIYLFETSDLFKELNTNNVANHIHYLAHFLSKRVDWNGPRIEEDLGARKNHYTADLIQDSWKLIDYDDLNSIPLSDDGLDCLDWANYKLSILENDEYQLKNLSGDIRNGIKLIKLVEILFNMPALVPYIAEPQYVWHSMRNAVSLLRFIELQTLEKVEGIRAPDIVIGRSQAIVHLLSYLREKCDFEYIYQRAIKESTELANQPQPQPSLCDEHLSAPDGLKYPEKRVISGFSDSENFKSLLEGKSRLNHLKIGGRDYPKYDPVSTKLNYGREITSQKDQSFKHRLRCNPLQRNSAMEYRYIEQDLNDGDSISSIESDPKGRKWTRVAPSTNNHPSQISQKDIFLRVYHGDHPLSATEIAEQTVRKKIANELWATEQSYLSNLHLLIDQFISPFEQSGIISSFEFETIFRDFCTICHDHDDFESIIARRVSCWRSDSIISDIFIDHYDFFWHYQPYLETFSHIEIAMRYISNKYPSFNQMVKQFEADQMAVSMHSIHSFLIMPVQRLPRYLLLLNDMKKYTPTYDTEHIQLGKLIDQMDHILKTMNNLIGHQSGESFKKVLQIALSIQGITMVLDYNRFYVCEGPILVKKVYSDDLTKKDIKKRKRLQGMKGYWFIFNDCIFLCDYLSQGKINENERFSHMDTIHMDEIIGISDGPLAMPSTSGSDRKSKDAFIRFTLENEIMLLQAPNIVLKQCYYDNIVNDLKETELDHSST